VAARAATGTDPLDTRRKTDMLTSGLHHVATITNDSDRLQAFYKEIFDADVVSDGSELPAGRGPRLTIIMIGDFCELNVFQIEGNTEADRQTPMFGRGRLDHFALRAASLEAFDEIRDRLIARGAADDFVTDFGSILSIFFRDPDGLEGEVCVPNPDAIPGLSNPPGTRAARYS
jgi:catechol 2,3-dioxygenase-like lactoylglutathione lyase family enzyme